MSDRIIDGKRCFLVEVTWYYNIPSQPHTKKDKRWGVDRYEVENKIFREYPNIQKLKIEEEW